MKKNSKSIQLSIILTVKNEIGNIERIVKSITSITSEQEIVFVDGNSSDGTKEEIKRLQRLYPEKNISLFHDKGTGQSDAIRIGFQKAHGTYLILFEGDGTSDTSDIKKFFTAISTNKYDYIQGNRFGYPLSNNDMPYHRQLGNKFFAFVFSYLFKLPLHDVLSGIKAIKKNDFEKIDKTWGRLTVRDPFGDFELLYGSYIHKLKIGELPMHYYERTYGASKSLFLQHGLQLLKFISVMTWSLLLRN